MLFVVAFRDLLLQFLIGTLGLSYTGIVFFNRCCRYVVRWFQGPGSWMAIDLPGATSLSGMEASFEDGDRRTQKFDIVLVGENEVRATASSTTSKAVRSARTSILPYLNLPSLSYYSRHNPSLRRSLSVLWMHACFDGVQRVLR